MDNKYERAAFKVFTASMAYIPIMMIAWLIIYIIDTVTGAESTFHIVLDRYPWLYVLITFLWLIGLLVSAWLDHKGTKTGRRKW